MNDATLPSDCFDCRARDGGMIDCGEELPELRGIRVPVTEVLERVLEGFRRRSAGERYVRRENRQMTPI